VVAIWILAKILEVVAEKRNQIYHRYTVHSTTERNSEKLSEDLQIIYCMPSKTILINLVIRSLGIAVVEISI
jgi:hypothetical protein